MSNSGLAEIAPDGAYGEGTGLILLDEVKCKGGESSLLECSHAEWGRHDCSHSEDVAMRCERGGNTIDITAVPLVPGNFYSYFVALRILSWEEFLTMV